MASLSETAKLAQEKAMLKTQQELKDTMELLAKAMLDKDKDKDKSDSKQKTESNKSEKKYNSEIQKIFEQLNDFFKKESYEDKDFEKFHKTIADLANSGKLSEEGMQALKKSYDLTVKKNELTKKSEKGATAKIAESIFKKAFYFLPEIHELPEKINDRMFESRKKEIDSLNDLIDENENFLNGFLNQIEQADKMKAESIQRAEQMAENQFKQQIDMISKLENTFAELQTELPDAITADMAKLKSDLTDDNGDTITNLLTKLEEANKIGNLNLVDEITKSIDDMKLKMTDVLNENVIGIKELADFANKANEISKSQLDFALEKVRDEDLTVKDSPRITTQLSAEKPEEEYGDGDMGILEWILLIGVGLSLLYVSFKEKLDGLISDIIEGFLIARRLISAFKLGPFFDDILKGFKTVGSKIMSPFKTLFGFAKEIPIIGKYFKMIGKVGTYLGKFGGLLGKLAWPLTAIFSIFDFYKGFNDDAGLSKKLNKKEEDLTGFDKTAGGISSVLNGLSFGILGKFDKNGEITGAISSGLEWIVDLFVGMWDGVTSFFTSSWTSITDFFKQIWKPIEDFYKQVEPKINQIWNSLKEIWIQIEPVFIKIGEFIKNYFVAQLDLLWEGLKILGDVLLEVGGFIFDNFVFALNVLWAIIEPLAIFIKDVVVNTFVLLWDTLTGFFNNLLDGINGLLKGIKQIFSGNFIEGIKTIFMTSINWLINSVKTIFSGVGTFLFDTFGSLIANVLEISSNLLGLFVEKIVSLKDSIVGVFSNIINDIWGLVSKMWNTIATKVNTWLPDNAQLPILEAQTSTAPSTAPTTQAKATGGRFTPNPLLVGENGPELIFPDYSGRVANATDTERIISNKESIIEKSRNSTNEIYNKYEQSKIAGSNINMPVNNINSTVINKSGGNNSSKGNSVKSVISSTIFDKLYNY